MFMFEGEFGIDRHWLLNQPLFAIQWWICPLSNIGPAQTLPAYFEERSGILWGGRHPELQGSPANPYPH